MLNKKDLIEIIAKQQETTKVEAKKIVDAFTDGIKSIMKDNKSVNITGFAKFESKYKEAYKRVFGVTSELIEVPAHHVHKATLSKKIAE